MFLIDVVLFNLYFQPISCYIRETMRGKAVVTTLTGTLFSVERRNFRLHNFKGRDLQSQLAVTDENVYAQRTRDLFATAELRLVCGRVHTSWGLLRHTHISRAVCTVNSHLGSH